LQDLARAPPKVRQRIGSQAYLILSRTIVKDVTSLGREPITWKLRAAKLEISSLTLCAAIGARGCNLKDAAGHHNYHKLLERL
jgi:hypothetical protein